MAQLKETTVTGGLTVDGVDVGEKMNLVDELNNNLGNQDSGWIEVDLSSDFKVYNNGTLPKYRKIGKMVEIRGIVSPVSVISDSEDNAYTIFTLPDGYRPSYSVNALMHGGQISSWRLTIATSGKVSFSRYRNATGAASTTTSTYLPFQVMFFID